MIGDIEEIDLERIQLGEREERVATAWRSGVCSSISVLAALGGRRQGRPPGFGPVRREKGEGDSGWP